MDNIELQKELVKFINFHNHPHDLSYNVVDGIVVTKNIEQDITHVMQLLRLGPVFLEYSKDTGLIPFLEGWANLMRDGKVIFVTVEGIRLNPIWYDQLINIKEKNEFNLIMDPKYGTWYDDQISPEAHLFLVFIHPKEGRIDQYITDLCDHVLDLRSFEK